MYEYPSQANAYEYPGETSHLNPLETTMNQHQQQPLPNYIAATWEVPTQAHASLEQQQMRAPNTNSNSDKKIQTAYVKIVEQPANKALRFRYECEGRTAGSIPGMNSTATKKTYPAIEIVGYQGRAVVVVSCVSKDPPYRPHPHNLIGKEGCKNGVCTLEVKTDTMRVELSSLGIQCVKKKDIEASLKAREDIRVDPFKTGFSHRAQPGNINVNAVRLCFQVFIEGDRGRFTVPLKPVVSEPIYDKKSMLELVIHQVCSSASVMGNTQIMLLCEKVAKEDIAVRFYEEKDGVVIWQAFGDFQPSDVHKQTSIRLRTPQYHNINIIQPVKAFVQLQRPSDGAVSEPWDFKFEPNNSNSVILRRKCQRLGLRPMPDQPQKQALTNHPGGRMLSWPNILPNVPPIAMDLSQATTSNACVFSADPEMTPPPDPLPPPNVPLYNKVVDVNTPLISASHQYQGGAEGAGSGSSNATLTPSTVNEHKETGANGRGQRWQQPPPQSHYSIPHEFQQHSTPQQQQQHHQQQQYFQDNAPNNTKPGIWEEQFTNVLALAAAAMSKLNGNSNQFNMQNLLAVTAPTGLQYSQWNCPLNNLQQQTEYNPNQLQNQQQQQALPATCQQQPHERGEMNQIGAVGGVGAVGSVGAVGDTERSATITNLLNLDSEQLVDVNCVDQLMFRPTTDELRLSNLTISV